MIRNFLDELGVAIEARGLGDVEGDVAVVVAAARAHGMEGVALDVLADRCAPEVTLARALARIAAPLIEHSRADVRREAELALDAAVS